MKIKLTNRSTFYYKTFLQYLVFCGFFLSTTALAQQTDPTPEIVDDDGDGLIEIYNIEQLNAIRFNLAGTGYKESEGASTVSTGCPTGCIGYELVRDLDFAETSSYASSTVNDDFRPTGGDPTTATNAGFAPIGYFNDDTDFASFVALFEGNGFAIRHLYVNSSNQGGLFGASAGTIRNLQVIDGYVKGDTSGGIVGINVGIIVNCRATGGSTAGFFHAGGLVGFQAGNGSRIFNSYATGEAEATGVGVDDMGSTVTIGNAGGLVGTAIAGFIGDCYATGQATGNNDAGGFVGEIRETIFISNCYATGVAETPAAAGGFIGYYIAGTVNKSYWDKTTSALDNARAYIPRDDFTGSTDGIVGLTTLEMEALTAVSTEWNTNDWNFGTANQYPALRNFELAGDPPNQIQGRLLCGQPGSRAQCAPPSLNAIGDQTMGVSGTQTFDLSTVFTDEETLTFTASSGDVAVSVLVTNEVLTITAVSVGSATIMVIANDGNGEETSGNFTVTVVANLPPRLLAAIADQTLEVGGTQMIDLSTVFTDEDDLTFTASSGDDAIVSVLVTGMGLTITAVSEGVATIMVIANDGTVETSSDFTVTVVANPLPTVVAAIADQDLSVGFGTKAVDLAGVFSDTDALTIAVESAESGVVTVALVDNTLTITEVGEGTSTITVTATDTGGGMVSDTFEVTVSALLGVVADLESTISVYPNPSETSFFITLPKSIPAKTIEVAMVSLSGKRVEIKVERKEGLLSIPVSHLPSGNYVLYFRSGNVETFKQVVIR